MRASTVSATLIGLALTAGSAYATPPGFDKVGMGQTPVAGGRAPKSVQAWWPEQVDLSRLRQNAYDGHPDGEAFDYAEAFAELDLDAVKADIDEVLTDSEGWWPADYGNYAGLFVRMAWHSAGTYRMGDGRGGANGGQQRFEPLNSWPDNASLDKARRLVWPIKQKYGHRLSWSDLMILAGNVALESSGFETLGFAGGRVDAWEPELVYWGPETKFLTAHGRFGKDGGLDQPLAAAEMALIYVNPEGPEGNPDILASAERIRTTFGRMAMNDEETAALIVGGHTLGKAHGANRGSDCVGAEPAAAGVHHQGFGWQNECGTGVGADAITSGLEGAWTATPVKWSNNYVENLYAFEWKKTKSPGGATQWVPEDDDIKFVPDAYDPDKLHAPVMFTTDLALRYDPAYGAITSRFLKDPDYFNEAFAKAWFKLTHRDMGPKARYLGPEVPEEDFVWQDPLPEAKYRTVDAAGIETLKGAIRDTDLTRSQLVGAAWAAATTFRDTDLRGGANGGRIALEPQNTWEVNNPEQLSAVLDSLSKVKRKFDKKGKGTRISLADLVVLGGVVAIEDAASDAGVDVDVPFTPGRVDATQDQTSVASFENLRPAADGFRNYYSAYARRTPTEMLVDRADMLTLTVPEMTVLVGGLRVLDANTGGSQLGVFTSRPGTLSNDFFTHLLDMSTTWAPSEADGAVFEGSDRASGEVKWKATEVDLVFGSNSELRAIAETYAFDDGNERLARDFVAAWTKVMELDRFDLK